MGGGSGGYVAKLVYLAGIKTMYTSNQFKPYIYIVVTVHYGRTDGRTDDNPEADGLRQSRLHSRTGVWGGGGGEGVQMMAT
jgi:hypothetical protein